MPKYPYYRQTRWVNKTKEALDDWYEYQEALGVPVAEARIDKQKGASIWLIGTEVLGPKGLGNRGANTKGPNEEFLDKAWIIREANGFSEAMGW